MRCRAEVSAQSHSTLGGAARPIEEPLISLTVTAVVFGVVFLAELPDKTALAGLVLRLDTLCSSKSPSTTELKY